MRDQLRHDVADGEVAIWAVEVVFSWKSGRLDRENMVFGPSKWVVAVALDRWSPLAGAIYSKKRRGDHESGREGRWSPLAGGRLHRVHCIYEIIQA